MRARPAPGLLCVLSSQQVQRSQGCLPALPAAHSLTLTPRAVSLTLSLRCHSRGQPSLGRACGGGALRAYRCSFPLSTNQQRVGSRAEVTQPMVWPKGSPRLAW